MTQWRAMVQESNLESPWLLALSLLAASERQNAGSKRRKRLSFLAIAHERPSLHFRGLGHGGCQPSRAVSCLTFAYFVHSSTARRVLGSLERMDDSPAPVMDAMSIPGVAS